MSQYLDELEKKGLSLLIYKGEKIIFSSVNRGMMPLLEAVDKIGRNELRGTIVADKVVGKAAALLTLYMMVDEVHAALISISAKKLLSKHGLRFYFFEDTLAIKNRSGTDICPFERLVMDIFDPREAYKMIKSEITELSLD